MRLHRSHVNSGALIPACMCNHPKVYLSPFLQTLLDPILTPGTIICLARELGAGIDIENVLMFIFVPLKTFIKLRIVITGWSTYYHGRSSS